LSEIGTSRANGANPQSSSGLEDGIGVDPIETHRYRVGSCGQGRICESEGRDRVAKQNDGCFSDSDYRGDVEVVGGGHSDGVSSPKVRTANQGHSNCSSISVGETAISNAAALLNEAASHKHRLNFPSLVSLVHYRDSAVDLGGIDGYD
jgi:hypothetical protein